ncbi:MAG: M61 family peptidase [Acidobacteriota bacterium]
MPLSRVCLRLAFAGLLACLCGNLAAQNPSAITLAVDASDAPRRIFHVRESMSAAPGTLTLLYPKWIPGEHGPTGPITDLVGIKISLAGRPIEWRRVPTEMWAFTCEIPAPGGALDIAFDYVAPLTSWTSASAQLTVINWWPLLLYPQGPQSSDTMFSPRLKLPAGWKSGTALPVERESGNGLAFATVSLVTLIDSPVLAGANFKTVDLTPGEKPGHWLHIAGDSAAAVEITPEDVAHYKRLVAEANALFGARHYANYHFLLTLSDHIPFNGLEHHESSDNRTGERAFLDDSAREVLGTLLSHEYVHSWNGKYRTPAGLVSGVTADYQQPIDSDLLWVYEGLTEYYGDVLGGRSGLRTPELYRENLALIGATMDHQAGRSWRPLVDTAVAAQLLYFGRPEWAAWRRGVDYYPESELIWLEADTLIRQKSGGKKSLDDFVRAFHGAPGGVPAVKTYTFEDVVAALNGVAANDWTTFLRDRIWKVTPRAPLSGIENGGWKLVYTDAKPQLTKASEETSKLYDFWYSLGMMVQGDGTSVSEEDGIIRDVVPGMPAAAAGVGPGMRLVAVNGRRYSDKVLRDALRTGRNAEEPLELLVENVEMFKTCKIDYHDGEKYPHLERDAGKPDVVSAIGKPRTAPEPAAKKPAAKK